VCRQTVKQIKCIGKTVKCFSECEAKIPKRSAFTEPPVHIIHRPTCRKQDSRFLPRGSGYGPVSVCLSVPVFVTSRCSIETTERIELVLVWELRSTYPTPCYGEIWVPQNKGTSTWNFVPNSGLGKFRPGKLIVLSTKRVDGRAYWPHL